MQQNHMNEQWENTMFKLTVTMLMSCIIPFTLLPSERDRKALRNDAITLHVLKKHNSRHSMQYLSVRCIIKAWRIERARSPYCSIDMTLWNLFEKSVDHCICKILYKEFPVPLKFWQDFSEYHLSTTKDAVRQHYFNSGLYTLKIVQEIAQSLNPMAHIHYDATTRLFEISNSIHTSPGTVAAQLERNAYDGWSPQLAHMRSARGNLLIQFIQCRSQLTNWDEYPSLNYWSVGLTSLI